jgi:hypothetical protein
MLEQQEFMNEDEFINSFQFHSGISPQQEHHLNSFALIYLQHYLESLDF